MDDLISRQAAIDELIAMREHIESRMSVIGCAAYEMAIEALREPERKTGKWIPCSERLPEVSKDVMVCYDFKGHRSVLIGVLYDDEKFHGYDDEYLTPEGRKYRKAVAWMPLPEPYKETNK